MVDDADGDVASTAAVDGVGSASNSVAAVIVVVVAAPAGDGGNARGNRSVFGKAEN